jgi:hypothetical protein
MVQVLDICTLVSDPGQYESMRKSFLSCGFNAPYVGFRIIDNTGENQKDAYEAYEYFRATSTAKYLLLVHQDVRAMSETYSALLEKLHELEALDPNWAIAGNAGKHDLWISGPIHIAEPEAVHRDSSFSYPAQVSSLDENFLIFNLRNSFRKALVGYGFHFYGTVLPLSAEKEGYRSYVIQFLVKHLSKGKMDRSFFDAKQSIEESGVFSAIKTFQPTTCTVFCFSRNERDKVLAFAQSFWMLLHDYGTHKQAVKELWTRRPSGSIRLYAALIWSFMELIYFHGSTFSFRETFVVLRGCVKLSRSAGDGASAAELGKAIVRQRGAQRFLSLLIIRLCLGKITAI